MNRCDFVYSVISVEVENGFVNQYIQFENKLNNYLLSKYEKCFLGLQLYRTDCTSFIVIAVYKNENNIVDIYSKINKYVEKEYSDRFNKYVTRKDILSLEDAFKIIC